MRLGIRMRVPMSLLLVATAVPAGADETAAAEPVAGELGVARDLVDPDFGVRAAALGLERRVRMYQWRRRDDGGYDAVWSGRPIDSDGHDTAHANPPWPEFGSVRWLNAHAVLNGRAVDADLFSALDGWKPLAVDAEQLPPNLAAVFEADGRGLVSSAEPAAPAIGDLRVRWFVLPGGPVHGRAVERDGRWEPGEDTGLARGEPPRDAEADEIPGLAGGPRVGAAWLWWAAGGALALLLTLLYFRRKN